MKNFNSLTRGVSSLFTLLLLALPIFSNQVKAFELSCPDDVTVDCDAELWDLSIYGNAEYYWDGVWTSAGEPTVTYNLGMCNTGTITRTWSVEDPYWNIVTCTQTIYVVGGSGGFGPSNIYWPADITLTGCDPQTHPNALPSGYDKPTYDQVNCSIIGISHTDYLYTVNNSCKKIMRVWKVIDCCQEGYDSNGNQTGIWTHTQKIKIINNDIPAVDCPDDIHVSSNNCSNAYVNAPALVVDATSCGGEYTITNNSPYASNNGADISGTYPIGTTYVTYSIKYGCGNHVSCSVRVVVADDKAPTPYCIGEIRTALMGIDNDDDGINDEGMVEIWAKDFDNGTQPACHGGPLTFSFSSDPTDMARTFTCDHVGANTVQIWVTDAYGNQDYCVSTLYIQNNGANIQDCEPAEDDNDDNDDTTSGDTTTVDSRKYTVSGDVSFLDNTPVSGVGINMITGLSDTSYVYTADTTINITLDTIPTDTADLYVVNIDTLIDVTIDTLISDQFWGTASDSIGKYSLDTVALDSSTYTVTATLDESHFALFDSLYTKEVNTADLQFLMDIVLNKTTFKNNAQRFAADINQDGNIDFDDVMAMYKLLTNQTEKLVEKQWIIVADKYLDEETQGASLNSVSFEVTGSDVKNIDFTVLQLGVLTQQSDLRSSDQMESLSEISSTDTRSNTVKGILESEVYPNPFYDRFALLYKNAEKGDLIEVEVYNLSGQRLFVKKVSTVSNEGIIEISEESLPTGMLVYRLINGDQVNIGKIIKK